jgi:hypothetical protein
MAEKNTPSSGASNKGMKNSSPDANNIGTPLKGQSVNSEPTRSKTTPQKTLGPRVA